MKNAFDMAGTHPNLEHWADRLDNDDWALDRRVMDLATQRGVRYAVGGGLAFSFYARRWRNTKDLDLFIEAKDRDAMVQILTEVGFEDYHDKRPYDRSWIYRGIHGETIVDVIWEMANHRAKVDDDWLTRGPVVPMRNRKVRMLPVEELIWAKLYVFQRERCDWPDLFSIMHAQASTIDWEHLLRSVGDDYRFLAGLLCAFSWLCPWRSRDIPDWLWARLGIAPPPPGPRCDQDPQRVNLLDSRPWFGAEKPAEPPAAEAKH